MGRHLPFLETVTKALKDLSKYYRGAQLRRFKKELEGKIS
jgi:hypothetical protein